MSIKITNPFLVKVKKTLEKWMNALFSISKTKAFSIAFITLLAISIPITVFVARQQQEIRQQAAGNCTFQCATFETQCTCPIEGDIGTYQCSPGDPGASCSQSCTSYGYFDDNGASCSPGSPACFDNSECNDGDPCTDDSCTGGQCYSSHNSNLPGCNTPPPGGPVGPRCSDPAYPVDCGTSYCCPSSHPVCGADNQCFPPNGNQCTPGTPGDATTTVCDSNGDNIVDGTCGTHYYCVYDAAGNYMAPASCETACTPTGGTNDCNVDSDCIGKYGEYNECVVPKCLQRDPNNPAAGKACAGGTIKCDVPGCAALSPQQCSGIPTATPTRSPSGGNPPGGGNPPRTATSTPRPGTNTPSPTRIAGGPTTTTGPGTPTSTPRPTTAGTPTNTPGAGTPTAVITGGTRLALNLKLEGIGGTGGNTNPLTRTRDVQVEIFNNQNQLVKTIDTTVTYNPSSSNFTGTALVGENVPTGNYVIKVKADRYLRKLVGNIQRITQGQSTTLPQTTLVIGDVNGDNILDIKDYSILLDCGYGAIRPLPMNNSSSLYNSAACKAHNQIQNNNFYPSSTDADLDDNGIINDIDYNRFIRSLINQKGD